MSGWKSNLVNFLGANAHVHKSSLSRTCSHASAQLPNPSPSSHTLSVFSTCTPLQTHLPVVIEPLTKATSQGVPLLLPPPFLLSVGLFFLLPSTPLDVCERACTVRACVHVYVRAPHDKVSGVRVQVCVRIFMWACA